MENNTTISALDKAREFVATNNIDVLLSAEHFQAEVMLIQGIILLALGYISFKVSKL